MKKMTRRERREQNRRQQSRRRIAIIVGGLGIVLLLIAGVVMLSAGSEDAADPFDNEQVALGQQLYVANCASCHGVNLEGQPDWQQANPDGSLRAPPHDETGHTWHHGDAALVESIKLGGARLPANVGMSPMPAYKDILTDEEITAILVYLKSTWPADIRSAQQSR